MGKMFELCFKGMLAGLIISFLGILFVVVAPPLLGINENSIEGGPAGAISMYVPVLVMLTLVLSGVLSVVVWILALLEITRSKSDTTWKAIWILVATFLFPVGLVLYYYIGRKNIRE